MDYEISEMKTSDWDDVSRIYLEGIDTGKATFQTEVPTFKDWDNGHLKSCRLVAHLDNIVIGWVALSPTSSRCVYKGVAEVSIYIAKDFKGNGIGSALLKALIKMSEENGIWTLQSGIIKENDSSIALHEKCGFRKIGTREKVAKTPDNIWHDTIIMERRSKIVGID